MSRNDPNESLAEKLGITDADLRERRSLLDFGPQEAAEFLALRSSVVLIIDEVIEEFYEIQLKVPAIRAMIGDIDTLMHLKTALKPYILELFSGNYGMDYVQRRLRIGRVHGRVGVPSKFYISAIFLLIKILGRKLEPQTGSPHPPTCLQRLLLPDIELTFDTYVHGLLAEVDAGREAIAAHSRQLEAIVAERTEQIEALSRIDQLTGLGNRAALREQLEIECKTIRLTGQTHCLLFLDLDGFKAVNDTQGHAAGDDMLRSLAQILRRSCRSSDRMYRYGGDEFCILMKDADAQSASQLRARLDEVVRSSTENRMGLSAGWALIGPDHAMDAESVLQEADKAMYADKKSRGQRQSRSREVAVLPGPDREGGTADRAGRPSKDRARLGKDRP